MSERRSLPCLLRLYPDHHVFRVRFLKSEALTQLLIRLKLIPITAICVECAKCLLDERPRMRVSRARQTRTPFRPGLAQLNHKRLQRRLSQVRIWAAHVAVVLAEAQQLGVGHFAKSLAQSSNVNVWP